jgi:antitoxin PrlF
VAFGKSATLSITFCSGITLVVVLVQVVSVTKKGQATIPKKLRKKYGIKDKVLIEETKTGIMLKPLPSPAEDFGSLKSVFKKQSAKELLEEARKEESAKDKEYVKRARASHV